MARGAEWVPARDRRPKNADKSYKDEGVALLDLARNAQRLFESKNRAKNAAC
jgi:hypothetical protein